MYAYMVIFLVTVCVSAAHHKSDITYYFHSQSTPQDGIPIKYNEILSKEINFDATKSTLVVIHGWWDQHNSEMNSMIVNAIMEENDINIIVVDWSAISGGLYGIAKSGVPFTGKCVGSFLHNLTSIYKISADDISIVGHSLGSHVAGIVGKSFNGKISFIVGLEPALPFVDISDKTYCLNKGDAKFVQVIHTSGGKLGFEVPVGDVDFFPNGGSAQPGCFFDIFANCAHKMAYKYYAESVRKNQFVAQQCISYENFKSGKCVGATALMGGYPVNTTLSGQYYLDTNSDAPYGKGDI